MVFQLFRQEQRWVAMFGGITGLSRPRVHIDGEVWHLDVASSILGLKEVPRVRLFAD